MGAVSLIGSGRHPVQSAPANTETVSRNFMPPTKAIDVPLFSQRYMASKEAFLNGTRLCNAVTVAQQPSELRKAPRNTRCSPAMRSITLTVLLLCACSSALAQSSAPADSHRAMAFNVLYRGGDTAQSLDAIEAAAGDILCLRELSSGFAKAFKKRFGSHYPYRRFKPRKHGTWGVGIASKLPLTDFKLFPQRPHRLPAAEATVHIGKKALVVVCVHLIPPIAKQRSSDTLLATLDKNSNMRAAQAEHIVARFRKRPAVLLLGDFNESRADRGLQACISAGYIAACDAPDEDCAATWPGAISPWPAILQIDHILGRGLEFAHARVLKTGGSDHYPVVADFRLK